LAWHTPLAQSAFTLHAPPFAQGAQTAPPQSTSVSLPFLTMSAHDGAWHTPPVHTPVVQSAPIEHS
jgi:hypothetical protein